MNADKLIKIAKLLDEKNLYSLADKVDRIAENISVNDKTILAQFSRNNFGLDQSGSGMDNFLKNTRMRYPGGASLIPGLSNQETRVMGPFGIDLGSKRFVDRQRAFGRGLRNLIFNTPEYQQYQAKYNTQQNQPQYYGQYQQQPQQQNQQPQMPQQQNATLASTTPQQFVQNLFAFGKQNNLQNLSQTIEMYAQQGGTYNGQPINQNPQVVNLYNQIKNNPATFNQQQLIQMLSGAGR